MGFQRRSERLNEDRTEALLFHPFKSSFLPDVLKTGQSETVFCNSACNLGVMFDNELTMKQQVDRICHTAYFEIWRIGSIHRFLTTEATKTFVVSAVLSRKNFNSSAPFLSLVRPSGTIFFLCATCSYSVFLQVKALDSPFLSLTPDTPSCVQPV